VQSSCGGPALRAASCAVTMRTGLSLYLGGTTWAANEILGEVLRLSERYNEVLLRTGSKGWLHRADAARCRGRRGHKYYPDNTINTPGVILGLSGIAGHAFLQENRGIADISGEPASEQDLSCVTAGCLANSTRCFPRARRIRQQFAHRFQRCSTSVPASATGRRIIWIAYGRALTPRVSRRSVARFTQRREEFHAAVALMRNAGSGAPTPTRSIIQTCPCGGASISPFHRGLRRA